MKNVTKISLAFIGLALIGATTFTTLQNPKDTSLESLRNQAQEAREREEQARRDREAREDNLSQALYDQCYSEALALTGTRFDEKQRWAYECWKSNTNGTYTGGTAPVPQQLTNSYVSNKSTIRHNPTGSSVHGGEILKTPQAQGQGLGETQKNRGQIPVTKNIGTNGSKSAKRKDENNRIAYATAIAQIQKWEGLRLSAYWDHAGYSIGWGTRANSATEKISRAEADRRLHEIVGKLIKKVQKDFPDLHPEGQGALVSFAYNCPRGYASVRKNGLQYHEKWCKTASGKKLRGLVLRRSEESKLIFR